MRKKNVFFKIIFPFIYAQQQLRLVILILEDAKNVCTVKKFCSSVFILEKTNSIHSSILKIGLIWRKIPFLAYFIIV
jgi:hypothetical protein